MTDTEIIDLYEQRSESAITATAKQYGSYCRVIAMNVLHNKEDADECVNDTYMSLWELIPPERPRVLSAYIGRIARNLSAKKYRARNAEKRGGGKSALLFSELEECIPDSQTVESEVDTNVLAREIDSFLLSLKEEDRDFFVNRYWYTDSVTDISTRFGVSESRVKMSLHRTRNKLKAYLEERGITL
ncbi:MAG: sigma-70 family RNA polymerase sigma factor [Oscillospiraceae bacterium]|nr:sigma-70 family RNA polymerase sigma factor [Oscillospiraceae bacterium]